MSGATIELRISDPSGRVIDTSTFPAASQRFSVQRTIAGGGPHTIIVRAAKEGYDPTEATLRVSC